MKPERITTSSGACHPDHGRGIGHEVSGPFFDHDLGRQVWSGTICVGTQVVWAKSFVSEAEAYTTTAQKAAEIAADRLA